MSSPLPTEPLLSMGIKKIIAVNVTPSKADILRQYDTIKQELATTYDTAGQHKWLSLTEYLKKRFKTNILDIIFSSIEVMQSEIALREALLADVVLHPDVTGIHWLELHRAREFARRGEEETRRNLDRIWQVINE
jgi:predicted acylesterase/phospholipase RssA